YQPEMTGYPNSVDGYFVIATDFDLTDSIRLQADYSSRNDWEGGYQAYWRATWMEDYVGTPFNIKHHINSALTINGVHQVKLRLMQDTNDDFRYWLDGSYRIDDYRVGINYRNWAFAGRDKYDGDPADASVLELYGKYEAGPNLTAFYRTNGSFGFICEIGFWYAVKPLRAKVRPPLREEVFLLLFFRLSFPLYSCNIHSHTYIFTCVSGLSGKRGNQG